MAFDIKVFKTRALSAVIFAALMLAGLFGGKIAFLVLFGAVCFVGSKEYMRIQERIAKLNPNDTVPTIYALATTLFFLYVAEAGGIYFLENIKQNRIMYIGTSVLLQLMATGMLNNRKIGIGLLLGYLYIPLSLGLLAQCYRMNAMLPVALIVLIWVNDTMQYIVGANFGKHKMAPVISPKKTWEGTIGGSLLCIIVALVWAQFDKHFSMLQWGIIAFCASVVGTLGDLVESMLKRRADIKDSGNIMPGHGGALDRFDSILLAGPVLYLLMKVFQ
jgi:phosphatidate cytidylyltransferase